MRAYFKDTDKIIINSLTHDEALIGKQFLSNLSDSKVINAEQRNDVNDDFDGLVLTIQDKVIPPVIPTYLDTDIKITKNTGTSFEASIVLTDEEFIFSDQDYILIDYDQEILDQLFKFMEDLGCTNVVFHTSVNRLMATTTKPLEATYDLPAGAFTYHQVHSDEVFKSSAITIEFKEVPEVSEG